MIQEVPKSLDLIDEMIKWHAILRSSEYLVTEYYNPSPKNIYNDILSDDMENFHDKVRGKREECWGLVENGHSIATVKYSLLTVLQGEKIEDLLHTFDDGNEEH